MAKKQNHPLQIHDAFFKELMSDLSVAKAFFEAFLPPELLEVIDLDTLKPTNISFVGDELNQFLSDIIFEVQRKDKQAIYLSVVVEHKSNPDKYVVIQFGKYLFGAYALQKKNITKQPMKAIVPVLFYHGTEPWEVHRLKDLIPDLHEDVHRFIPDFDIHMIALNTLSDEQLLNLTNGLLSTAMFMQKNHKDTKRIEAQLTNIILTLAPYLLKNKKLSHLVYLFRITEFAPETINQKLEALPPPIKSEIMSTYDMLIEKGMEKGLEKVKEEKFQATKNMILEGFENFIICKVLNVSNDYVEQVRKGLEK